MDKKKGIGTIQKGQISKEEKQFLYNQYSGKCQVCQKRIVKKDGSYYFESINLMDTSILEEKYLTGIDVGWNSLCLCPNCAAEYRYGAVSMYDFKDRINEIVIDKTVDDYLEFDIKMQGEERVLRYSPVHLFALQTALSYFDKKLVGENNEECYKQENNKNEDIISGTEILRVNRGDECPICGKKNTRSTILAVTDIYGKERRIEGLHCECGTNYLTKRLYERLHDPNKLNILKVNNTDLIGTEINKENMIGDDKNSSKRLIKQTGGVFIVRKKR